MHIKIIHPALVVMHYAPVFISNSSNIDDSASHQVNVVIDAPVARHLLRKHDLWLCETCSQQELATFLSKMFLHSHDTSILYMGLKDDVSY